MGVFQGLIWNSRPHRACLGHQLEPAGLSLANARTGVGGTSTLDLLLIKRAGPPTRRIGLRRRWPAGGPGRITISAAQRPLRLWGEVDLHFN